MEILLLIISGSLSYWIVKTIDQHYRSTWKWYVEMLESNNIVFWIVWFIIYMGLIFLITAGVAFFAGYEW